MRVSISSSALLSKTVFHLRGEDEANISRAKSGLPKSIRLVNFACPGLARDIFAPPQLFAPGSVKMSVLESMHENALGEFTYIPRLSNKIQTYQTDFVIFFFSQIAIAVYFEMTGRLMIKKQLLLSIFKKWMLKR